LRSDLPADSPGEPGSPGHDARPASPGDAVRPGAEHEQAGAAGSTTPATPTAPSGNGAPSGNAAAPAGNAAAPGETSAAPGGTSAAPGGNAAAPGGNATPGRDGAPARPAARAGRNLPAAVGVGVGLGGVAILTLFTVKVTFLIYMGVMVAVALWEFSRAVTGQGIRLPIVPVAVGGFTGLGLAYWRGERPLVACLAFTVIAILAWRLHGGAAGYLRDVTAGVFALGYLLLPACFVGLMLDVPDGARRTLLFLILAVCSDVGGYFAGVLLGHHPMAPAISPKKTWEGFGGSAFACVLGGAITMSTLLSGAVWQGILIGVAVLAAATLGDLAESMMKRDLGIKDMGSVLPGHGGVLDRIDSLLLSAPVVWVLLLVFVPALHQH
jgi:phosphatidate cytidylyltransferase